MALKTSILLTTAFILLIPSSATAQRLNLLFIGNSYIYSNGGLSGLVADLAQGAGFQRPISSSQVGGGLTLTDHCTRQETLDAIDSRSWDYIILQEYDYGPTHYGEYPRTPDAFFDAVRTLNNRIQLNNALYGWNTKVVILETWARAPGGTLKYPDNIPAYPDVFKNPQEMQAELRSATRKIAGEIGAIHAAVGDAWEHAYNILQYPELNLHAEDKSHPSNAGSYLNGLILLKIFYGLEDTYGLPYENLAFGNLTITAEEAEFLQGIANFCPFYISSVSRNDVTGDIIIRWKSAGTFRYIVWYSDDPWDESMTWTVAEEDIPASGNGENIWTDNGLWTGSHPSQVQERYYKVTIQQNTEE